jgi:prolyl oligopeptidase
MLRSMRSRTTDLLLLAARGWMTLLFAACAGEPHPTTDGAGAGDGGSPWGTPPTRTDPVVETLHGAEVADPYRWLEDQDGAEVAAWVAAQNAATRAVLDALPARADLRERLRELWNYARYEPPERAGDRWFFRKNDGLQNQPVLYVSDDPQQDGKVLLDPNTLSPDGTVALAALAIDEQGQRVAYATSASGSDWREWRVLDVATGATLPDRLQWSKFGGAAWTHDGVGFFYQRYPAPQPGATFEAINDNAQLCYHRLGAEQAADRVVLERPDEPKWSFGGEVTDDGRLLVIRIGRGSERRNRVAVVDLQQPEWPVAHLPMDFDAAWDFVGNDGDRLFFRTDFEAPRGRVLALDWRAPEQRAEIVPQQQQPLRSVQLLGGRLLCSYLEDATSRVRVHGLDGAVAGELPLPALGTASGFRGRPRDRTTFFTFTTFTAPPAVWRYDLDGGVCAPFRAPAFGRADADLEARRVFLQSRDGTRLPLFLVHKRGIALDGNSPCYLFGYGGFDAAMTPRFSVPNLVFVERGGIYAQAVLRGGGEYGEAWHRAGMLGQKQNVFDDFVACAEYLLRNGYTSTPRLAVGGGSNGGLLVGAVLTQRPDLFGAAVPEVGVLDMLRYHKFTIGWAWAAEYGTSDDPEQFAWLLRYSPLHNVVPGTRYPATLVMTGDHDDRVLPGHSYKFAAALQAAQAGPAPILLRVETQAGHGAGKPVQKLIDEAADKLAFLDWALGNGD